jgi:hypothetical protein
MMPGEQVEDAIGPQSWGRGSEILENTLARSLLLDLGLEEDWCSIFSEELVALTASPTG